MSGPKIGSFSFQRSQNCLPRFERRKVRMPKIVPPIPRTQKIPFAAHEVADVDQELRRRRQLRAEVLEDFAEDRNDLHDQEGGDRERDADDDDRIGHGRLHLLAQARARFEEAGQTIENFREQTAVFTGFDHADEKPIEDARMFAIDSWKVSPPWTRVVTSLMMWRRFFCRFGSHWS